MYLVRLQAEANVKNLSCPKNKQISVGLHYILAHNYLKLPMYHTARRQASQYMPYNAFNYALGKLYSLTAQLWD